MSQDVPICGWRESPADAMCREGRHRMPDGSLALRCLPHLGLGEPDQDNPFSAQRSGPSVAQQARAGMIEVVTTSIKHMIERGVLVAPEGPGQPMAAHRAAAVVVDDLATHVLTQTVAGMVSGQVQSG